MMSQREIKNVGLLIAAILSAVNILQVIALFVARDSITNNGYDDARSVWSLIGVLGGAVVFLPAFVPEALRAHNLRESFAWWLLALALVSEGAFAYWKPSVSVDWRMAVDAIFAFVYLASFILLRERRSDHEPLT